MNISEKYVHNDAEEKWYAYWLEHGFFHSEPNEKEPYTIVMPPPNVTGILHMGHMLNNTIQDILIRRARMQGKNGCWVPGTDHASIATEAKVKEKLLKEGIDPNRIGREEFLKHAWDWKEKHGNIILNQLKKLGASCDWERTAFTMDQELSESVIQVFVDLYEKGLIYKGVRMVNWDPIAQTAVSNEEVIHKEEQSKLYYLQYKIKDSDECVTIATTRPETILGDTAICIHPDDKRYTHLHNKEVIIPIINRTIPIITDSYVDMEFGTGCLKITPAHDENDYHIGLRHNLESINIFHDDGTLNEHGTIFEGKDRFEVRREIIPLLKTEGSILKIEDYTNKVGYSERTHAVIEPKLSTQWFLSMKQLVKPALKHVMNDDIQFHPPKFKNMYRHWMEGVQDWCISRQLWWGHRIPAYYLPDGTCVVATTKKEALKKAIKQFPKANYTSEDLKQDEDVLDTWFSSWLWPISLFDGIRTPNNEQINYYYPSDVLVTAPEIIFFWVARMIISGYEYQRNLPFKNVYFTGIVRDKERRKMSKSLGNSPDPIELMKLYGADGVRVGMLVASPAGNDLLYDESLSEQGRNFSAKIWNAFRLIQSWTVDSNLPQPSVSKDTLFWFQERLKKTLVQLEEYFEQYRISDALMELYTLFRDDFSSWLLEAIKPKYQHPIDSSTKEQILSLLEDLLKLIHPFMPFITEELWHALSNRKEGESIMITTQPKAESYNKQILEDFEIIQEIVRAIRNIRSKYNLPKKEPLTLLINKKTGTYPYYLNEVIKKLAHITHIDSLKDKHENGNTFLVKTTEFFVPISKKVDTTVEKAKLEEELKRLQGFLFGVEKKLNNQQFFKNAPEKVIALEKKKQADTLDKIKTIKEQLE